MSVVVSAIMVSYNTRELSLAAVRSLRHETRTPMEIVLIDNESSDGSMAAFRAEFEDLTLIQAGRNLGFAAANNRAARVATGKYLLLINPDTVVLDRAVDSLVAFAEANPEAGIWGGRTLFPDGRLNHASCWRRQTLWSVFCCASGLSSLFRRSSLFNPEAYGGWKRDTEREVDIVSGCFLLISRELWERLVGFDPAFFMYGEEADLCLRARALGARPRVTPNATIVHYGGASETVRSDKMVRLLKAKTLLIRRHWPRWKAPLGVAVLSLWPLTRAVAWSLLRTLNGAHAESAATSWWAVWSRRREWLDGSSPSASGLAPAA